LIFVLRLLALLLCLQPLSAQDSQDASRLADSLRSGAWNERVRAVNKLGALGGEDSSLREALADPDWQVRLAAAHWLGTHGRSSWPALEDLLGSEACPLVRMSAVHWLGRMGRRPKPSDAPAADDSMRGCESWFWPISEETLSMRHRSVQVVVATPTDGRGCFYARYARVGRTSCPKGTVLKGVGPAPGNVELLEDNPPTSGVALCCRADPGQAAPPGEAPAPQEAECRLLPEECPSGWVEMEPRSKSPGSKKDFRYERTKRHKEGDLPWVHCCRKSPAPPQEPAPEEPAGVPSWTAPDASERLAAIPFGDDAEEEDAPPPRPASLLKPREPEPAPGPREPSEPGRAVTLEVSAPVEALLEELGRGTRQGRERAALALARLGPKAAQAAERLETALRRDASPRVRACAALALASVTRGTDRAVPALRRALSDSHAGVRADAAQSLGVVGTPAAQKAFLDFMRSEAGKLIRGSPRP